MCPIFRAKPGSIPTSAGNAIITEPDFFFVTTRVRRFSHSLQGNLAGMGQ